MKAWGSITDQVLHHIEYAGPLSVADVQVILPGVDRDVLRKTCARLAKDGRLHVLHWVRDAEGERDYPRPVYAFGQGENAKRPAPNTRGRVVSDWQRKKTRMSRMNFVFNLGQ